MQVAVYDLSLPGKAPITTQQGPVAPAPIRAHMPCLEIVWKCDAQLLEIYFEQAWSHGVMNFIVKRRTGSPVLGTYTEEKQTLFQEHFGKSPVAYLGGFGLQATEVVSLSNTITRFTKTLRTALQPVFHFPAVPESLPAEAIAAAVKYNTREPVPFALDEIATAEEWEAEDMEYI